MYVTPPTLRAAAAPIVTAAGVADAPAPTAEQSNLREQHAALVADARARATDVAVGAGATIVDAAAHRVRSQASSTAGGASTGLHAQWQQAMQQAAGPHPFDTSHSRLLATMLGAAWLVLDVRVWQRRRRARRAT